MKKGTPSYSTGTDTQNGFGIIRLGDEARATLAARIRRFRALPFPGMKYFPYYGEYAINERNAKRKAILKQGGVIPKTKTKTNWFSNIYKRLVK